MFRFIYSKPLPVVLFFILVIVLIWAVINTILGTKQRGGFVLVGANFCVFLGVNMAILYATIFSREMKKNEMCFIPFYSFVMAQEQPEMYRSMFMNVLLFVPFGLSLPYVLKETCRGKIKVTGMSAALFSLCIEVLQYVFVLGRAEIDDVICNTLGAFVGSLSFVLYSMSKNKKIRFKRRYK